MAAVSLAIVGGVLGMVASYEQMRQLRAPRGLGLFLDLVSAVLGALAGFLLGGIT